MWICKSLICLEGNDMFDYKKVWLFFFIETLIKSPRHFNWTLEDNFRRDVTLWGSKSRRQRSFWLDVVFRFPWCCSSVQRRPHRGLWEWRGQQNHSPNHQLPGELHTRGPSYTSCPLGKGDSNNNSSSCSNNNPSLFTLFKYLAI